MGTSMGDARYSEDEVALVLRRAAELQKRETLAEDPGSMSLPELEAVAAEAGLSPALVRRAATEIARPMGSQPEANPWLGGVTHLVIERTIDGEYPQDELDRLLEAVRSSSSGAGQVSTVGRTLTWSGALGTSQSVVLTVTVTVRDGQTRLRLHANFANLAGGVFGGIGGGVGGGLGWTAFLGGGLIAGPIGAIGLGVGFLASVYAVCRRTYRGQTLRHTKTVRALADELERVIERRVLTVD